MKKKRISILLLSVIIVVLLICGLVFHLFTHYYSNSNFVNDTAVKINYDYLEQRSKETELTLDASAIFTGYVGENDMEAELVVSQVTKPSEEVTADTYNLLLIGVDRRNDDWYGNSDTMILITVNYRVQKIFMTSFMRDLYADIPGFGIMKLNAAHAVGGGPLLVETLEKNYGVEIDNYARVDFSSMADIIDVIGGVDIELSDAEVQAANDGIYEACALQNKDYLKYKLSSSGELHLNGIQAVAYGRIRRIGNADYERTSRQREVLTKLFEKLHDLEISELVEVMNEVLPLITHNVNEMTILSLLPKLPELLSYELVSERVPYDGMFTSRNELLVPDMEATVQRLHDTIYATDTEDNSMND